MASRMLGQHLTRGHHYHEQLNSIDTQPSGDECQSHQMAMFQLFSMDYDSGNLWLKVTLTFWKPLREK